MSYKTISIIRGSQGLTNRIIACAYEQRIPNAEQWVYSAMWEFAASPGWSEAWESFQATFPGGQFDPGGLETVITDLQILSAVQNLRPLVETPEEPLPEE